MFSRPSEQLEMDHAIFAFSHCRDVIYRLLEEYVDALDQVTGLMPGDQEGLALI